METKITCPLGHTCEKAVDGHLEVCAWWVELAGNDPQTGQPLQNVKRCAIAWMPLLQVEVAGTNRGQTAAIESFRNETVNGQNMTNKILHAAATKRIEDGTISS